jgi:regulator of protease activity HflC (stomatin/prohibitin superfamily)
MTHKFAVAIAAAALSGCAYASVGSGEVAVVRTPAGVDNKVYGPGDWRIGGDDKATVYNVRSQEHGEQLSVQASDGLGITLDASVRYHPIPDEAVALDKELGPNYYDVLLGPTLRSQARRVVGRFKPEEIYSSQRELIEKQIREGMETAIKGRHIQLEAVLIRNVTLPEAIQLAINNKLEAEQSALKMKFVLEQQEAEDQKQLMESKADAERAQIAAQADSDAEHVKAKSEADAELVAAQAAADAKRLDAQATADYQKLVEQHLTPSILKLQQIDATRALANSPNAKLIWMSGTGTASQLDLRDK